MSVPMCVCVDKIVNMCSYTYVCMYVCVAMPVSVLSAWVVSC